MNVQQLCVLAAAPTERGYDACRERLSSLGLHVVPASTSEDAFSLALDERPDAIVLSTYLPGVGSLVERLRQHPHTKGSLIFVIETPESGGNLRSAEINRSKAAVASLEEITSTLVGLQRFSAADPNAGVLFQRVLDFSPDPMLTINACGRIVLVNAQAESAFGYPRNELLGQRVEVLVPLRSRAEHEKQRANFTADAKARPLDAGLELRALRRDGAEFPVEISLSPFEVGGERFVTAVVRDATARRRVERALKENMAWLDAILEASRDGIIVEERERIIFVNRAYVHLYGYDRADELLGQHVSVVQAAEDNERMLEFGRRRVAGEAVPEIYEFTGRRKDGSTIGLEASVAIHAVGERQLIITIVRDVSERKRADLERSRRLAEQAARLEAEAQEKRAQKLYREASEASRLKDEFLATLSHELRTPLNAMLGWARLLRSGTLDAGTRERAIESIERNTRLQAQLVSDILDVSRIITGKLRLDRGAVDLVPLIESGLDSIRPAADAKGLQLSMHVEGRIAPILADGDRLLQVVWNLLANAVKFTPEGGKVAISLSGGEGFVEIVVRDNGVGIAPGFLPFVFDRFRQADASTTRVYGGLGLGLAIVRHLVEQHGGTVDARSEGEGRGAAFTVRIPARPAPPPSRHPDPARAERREPLPPPGRLDGMRVLVVDDEPDARALFLATLQAQGASVVTAASAAQAFDIFNDFHPDVLVADVGMPGEDGYSLIRRIRALPEEEGGRVPAVAVTAYARREDRAAALAAGFERHLAKPFEPADLAAVIVSLTAPRTA